MSMSNNDDQEIIEHLRLLTYVNAASVSLWVYDYFLTFSLELSVFWRASWTLSKVLLLLTRYMPFATSATVLYLQFQSPINQASCMATYTFIIWIIFICTWVSAAILTLRNWAVWESSRRLGIALLVFSLVIWVPAFICDLLIVKSAKMIYIPNTFLWSGCSAVVTSHAVDYIWILAIVFELVSLALISIKGYQALYLSRVSDLHRVVYINGILGYSCILALTIINLIVTTTVSRDLAGIFMFPEQMLQSILTCRLMFELRRYGKCVVRGDDFSNITSGFIVPLDTLVFRQATTAATRDTLDTQWALGTSLEPDIEFDESYKDGDDPQETQSQTETQTKHVGDGLMN